MLIGSVVPRRVTRISAQVAGLVVDLQVDEADRVSKEDELFRLDDALASIEVRKARAQLAQAEAQVQESARKLSETERLHREGHVPLTTLETAQTDMAITAAQRDERKADPGSQPHRAVTTSRQSAVQRHHRRQRSRSRTVDRQRLHRARPRGS